jgi:hypothetical protein
MKRETSRGRGERQRKRGSALAQAPLSISSLIELLKMVYILLLVESYSVQISGQHPRMHRSAERQWIMYHHLLI